MKRKKVFEQTWMTFLSQRSETEEEEEGCEATNTVNGKYLDRFFPINCLGLTKKQGKQIFYKSHF